MVVKKLEDGQKINKNVLGEHKVITPEQQFLGIILWFFMYLKWPWLLGFFYFYVLSLNGFYSIFEKKRNSHGHLKSIKKHKITPKSCCLIAIMLCSIYFELFSVEKY